MVARIKNSKNASYILHYNELKVSHNAAALIHSSGFLNSAERLSVDEKKERFERLNSLNDRVKVNMLHISLNFHPSDNLSRQQLQAISDRYMEGIGFKDQPYLVYQHTDVGHPHMHIVTSTIRPDGARIPLHNIGKEKSSPIRQAINSEFDLASPMKFERNPKQSPGTDVQKVIYGGDRPTKESIADVLRIVNKEYRFTSLQEYNAILRIYNVYADTGSKNSRQHLHGGLTYRALTEEGKQVGVPLKASEFEGQPTLSKLESKYKANQQAYKDAVPAIRSKLNWILTQEPGDLGELIADLKKEGIEPIAWKNATGKPDTLTFVDLNRKAAVNETALGASYSLASVSSALQFSSSQENTPTQQEKQSSSRTLRVPQPLSQAIPQQDDLPQQELTDNLQIKISKRR